MMENLSLLERFSDPNLIQQMPLGEKLLASSYVAILGMAITFVALVILWGLIIIMGKMLNTTGPKKEAVKVQKAPVETKPQATEEDSSVDDEELIAVITAAVAASMNTSTHNIVVRDIVRVVDETPAWGKAGRLDQMSTRRRK
jgi:sodium pump decarboxylase gamma subunit